MFLFVYSAMGWNLSKSTTAVGRFGSLSFLFSFSLYPQKLKFEEFMEILKWQRKKSFPFAESFLRVFKKNRAVFVHPFHKRKAFYLNFFPLEQNLHLPLFYFLSLSVPSQFRNKRNKIPLPEQPLTLCGGLRKGEFIKNKRKTVRIK